MEMRLRTKEQEQLVLNNYRLIWFVVRKFNSKNVPTEDMFSVGEIGLIKAAVNYKETKGKKFSTFAISCIKNEICLYLKQEIDYYDRVVSIDQTVKSEDSKEKNYYNILYNVNINILKQIEERDLVTNYINIIINAIDAKNRTIMLYRISGMTYSEISKIFNTTLQNIENHTKRTKEKVGLYFDTNKKYNKIYTMNIEENSYTISFYSKNIKMHKKIFSNFLQKNRLDDKLVKINVNYNRGLILIRLPARMEMFKVIANIIIEIENYNLENSGDKN